MWTVGRLVSLFAFFASLDIMGPSIKSTGTHLGCPILKFRRLHSSRLSAVISDGRQILKRHTFSNWLRVVSHLKRNASSTSTQENTGAGGSLDNLGGTEGVVLAHPSRSEVTLGTPNPSAPPATTTAADEGSESTRQQSPSLIPPVQNREHVHTDQESPVLTRVNPRRGPTSGGEEIDLIVNNLTPSILLFARFGANITYTVRLQTPNV
jgi:hypothetical protein